MSAAVKLIQYSAKRKLVILFLSIFTHHRFSDTLVENQIPRDLSFVFHMWTPFCKCFLMDYGGGSSGSERNGMETRRTSSRGVNWQKQVTLLQQITFSSARYHHSNLVGRVTSARYHHSNLVGRGKQYFALTQ